jgi:citryl-CoA synthetase large subunit
MKLKEFESKQVISSAGIPISRGILIKDLNDIPEFSEEKILKVQTLSGGRGKAGGILPVQNQEQTKHLVGQFLGNTFLNEQISEILLDEKINIENELYLGMMFDTTTRKPVLIFSEEGGVDIEEVKNIKKIEIDYLQGIVEYPTEDPKIRELIDKLYTCFIENDCRMIEINPLVKTKDNYVAVDAVVVLDDDAKHRWKIPFEERTDNRKATDREIRARLIDKDDHRGVAGKTFIDLDGDIAILTSGGGATMTLMDALIEFGGKPANLTEYSGNPPQEKVEKLTRIVLEKEGLKGLLVAGVVANFTNIYETLQGVLNVLIEKKPKFPIVIRRVGVEWEKAREAMMKAKEEHGLDIHYLDDKTPLTETAKEMVRLAYGNTD